ncbi:MAG: hypothetical protein GXP43_02525 [bacterium]|nr:hypothetical protein [bacterium]
MIDQLRQVDGEQRERQILLQQFIEQVWEGLPKMLLSLPLCERWCVVKKLHAPRLAVFGKRLAFNQWIRQAVE